MSHRLCRQEQCCRKYRAVQGIFASWLRHVPAIHRSCIFGFLRTLSNNCLSFASFSHWENRLYTVCHGPVVFRKIPPGIPGVHDPENSIQEVSVIRLRSSGFLWRITEKWFDPLPLGIIDFIPSCHLCAPHDYLCRNHIIHDTSDFCEMLFDSFQTIVFRNTL